jgi:hypothetical protein
VAQQPLFRREKTEYLRQIFIECTDFFTIDKGVFIRHTHESNIDKHCFDEDISV